MKNLSLMILILSIMTIMFCSKKSPEQKQEINSTENEASEKNELTGKADKKPFTIENLGVITGDMVNARMEPQKTSTSGERLFKGNKVVFVKFVTGDDIDGNNNWALITSPYFYNELYVHSAFIKTGTAAQEYLKNFSYDEQFNKLSEDFSAEQIQSIKNYHKAYHNIKSLEDFVAVYQQAISLEKILSPVVQKKYDLLQTAGKTELNMAWIYNLLPGMSIGYEGEGTIASFYIVNDTFAEKADITEHISDDTFVEILQASYGPTIMRHRPLWFQYTWDYGGQSMLGTGIHLKILKMIDKALKKDKTFEAELNEIKASIITDISETNNFYEDKTALNSEIDKILKEIILTDEQKNAIQKKKGMINSDSKELQINCKNNNCNFG